MFNYSNAKNHRDLRQIPDTQEVFLSSDSDVTYIVEILQSVSPINLEEAIK